MAARRKFNETEKYCPRCEMWLLHSHFNKAKESASGLRSLCKKCESSEIAAWATRKRRKDTRWGLLKSAKQRAKAEGIAFDLCEEDIYVPMICPALGVPIKYGGKFAGPNSPSLDRAVPKLGYVSGNVFVISFRANAIKNDAYAYEMEKIARYARMVQETQ